MKKNYRLICLVLALSIISGRSFSQNNLAPGDLAIASYQSDFDPTNPLIGDDNIPQFEDRFSLVVTKAGGLAGGTVIFFTSRGWNGPNNTWHDGDYPPFTFGLGRRAVVQWTVPAGGIVQGSEIFFINTYHDEVAVGSEYYSWAAYSDQAGTTVLSNLTNVTPIVPAANSTDGMSFAVSGDKMLVYQTGPVAGPTGGFNATPIRFITAILANINGTTAVAGTTSYASWDAVPGAQASSESSIPPGLVNGQTCFLMSPGPLPAVSNGTTEPDNGKFSACALSSAGTCTALGMSAMIYTISNWTYSNSVFPVGTSSSLCTYNILAANTISLFSPAGTNAQTKCINTAITNIVYNTTGATGATVSGLPAGVGGAWASNVVTISGTPTASGTFSYTVTLTGGCGTVTATGSVTVTANNTVTLTSPAGTNAQTICMNTAITNIMYSTTGATGATVSGLPANVTGAWAGNVVSISGTPTVSGTFNYTVTLTGGCSTVTANGSITSTMTGTWLGINAGTNNWNDAANWCGGIPTASTDVIILPGKPNQPSIGASQTAICHKITTSPGVSVNIGGSANLTITGQ